ncbi:MAG TPA: nucleotidyltransferase family protein [Chitinophagaceae bacterium]|nr:nucleotidyltransferase family protein [Chitinophagaceae bacterium]
MKLQEAIILAGGLGTRLRTVLPDTPKCMALVNGKPFIAYVIEYFQSQGIEKFIFALGYKHEIIQEYLSEKFSIFNFQFSIESEPLGTGGAIQLACKAATQKNVVVVNGDTLFKADIQKQMAFHESHHADCTLGLKLMQQFERYGVVELNEDNSIKNFKEKQYYEEGFINCGLYILNREKFLNEHLPERFSFEKDYLEKYYSQHKMFGCMQDAYFIDIGIPQDYERAQQEFA